MLDQVVNACQDNPSQETCPFCHAKPLQVNDSEADFTPVSDAAFVEICLSILHFTINMFRLFCTIGARIKANVKQYKARGERKRAKIDRAHARIYDQLDQRLGLQLGLKRYADGNMARKAFENLDIFSEITGISVELLERFNVIRIALASNLKKVHFLLSQCLENHPKGAKTNFLSINDQEFDV